MQKIISFTGHRPNKLNKEYDLYGPVTDWIEKQITKILIEEKPDKCIVGGALGVDTLAALICIKLKIPFLIAIPCDGQEKMWSKKSQKLYHEILCNPIAEKIIVTPGPYNPRKMQIRNEWMSNNSNKIITVWDGSSGGTGNAVKYAESINKEIIRIDPTDILEKVRRDKELNDFCKNLNT